MTHEERQEQLFPKLSDDELRCLAPHGTEVALASGETLFTKARTNTISSSFWMAN